MSVTGFEILHDETIELLDENNENILLRMLRIRIQNKQYATMLFDSKERVYVTCLPHDIADMSCFHYLPTNADISCFHSLLTNPNKLTLVYTYRQFKHYAHKLTDDSYLTIARTKCGGLIIEQMIIKYFYENRNEYLPTYGLTNFELK